MNWVGGSRQRVRARQESSLTTMRRYFSQQTAADASNYRERDLVHAPSGVESGGLFDINQIKPSRNSSTDGQQQQPQEAGRGGVSLDHSVRSRSALPMPSLTQAADMSSRLNQQQQQQNHQQNESSVQHRLPQKPPKAAAPRLDSMDVWDNLANEDGNSPLSSAPSHERFSFDHISSSSSSSSASSSSSSSAPSSSPLDESEEHRSRLFMSMELGVPTEDDYEQHGGNNSDGNRNSTNTTKASSETYTHHQQQHRQLPPNARLLGEGGGASPGISGLHRLQINYDTAANPLASSSSSALSTTNARLLSNPITPTTAGSLDIALLKKSSALSSSAAASAVSMAARRQKQHSSTTSSIRQQHQQHQLQQARTHGQNGGVSSSSSTGIPSKLASSLTKLNAASAAVAAANASAGSSSSASFFSTHGKMSTTNAGANAALASIARISQQQQQLPHGQQDPHDRSQEWGDGVHEDHNSAWYSSNEDGLEGGGGSGEGFVEGWRGANDGEGVMMATMDRFDPSSAPWVMHQPGGTNTGVGAGVDVGFYPPPPPPPPLHSQHHQYYPVSYDSAANGLFNGTSSHQHQQHQQHHPAQHLTFLQQQQQHQRQQRHHQHLADPSIVDRVAEPLSSLMHAPFSLEHTIAPPSNMPIAMEQYPSSYSQSYQQQLQLQQEQERQQTRFPMSHPPLSQHAPTPASLFYQHHQQRSQQQQYAGQNHMFMPSASSSLPPRYPPQPQQHMLQSMWSGAAAPPPPPSAAVGSFSHADDGLVGQWRDPLTSSSFSSQHELPFKGQSCSFQQAGPYKSDLVPPTYSFLRQQQLHQPQEQQQQDLEQQMFQVPPTRRHSVPFSSSTSSTVLSSENDVAVGSVARESNGPTLQQQLTAMDAYKRVADKASFTGNATAKVMAQMMKIATKTPGGGNSSTNSEDGSGGNSQMQSMLFKTAQKNGENFDSRRGTVAAATVHDGGIGDDVEDEMKMMMMMNEADNENGCGENVNPNHGGYPSIINSLAVGEEGSDGYVVRHRGINHNDDNDNYLQNVKRHKGAGAPSHLQQHHPLTVGHVLGGTRVIPRMTALSSVGEKSNNHLASTLFTPTSTISIAPSNSGASCAWGPSRPKPHRHCEVSSGIAGATATVASTAVGARAGDVVDAEDDDRDGNQIHASANNHISDSTIALVSSSSAAPPSLSSSSSSLTSQANRAVAAARALSAAGCSPNVTDAVQRLLTSPPRTHVRKRKQYVPTPCQIVCVDDEGKSQHDDVSSASVSVSDSSASSPSESSSTSSPTTTKQHKKDGDEDVGDKTDNDDDEDDDESGIVVAAPISVSLNINIIDVAVTVTSKADESANTTAQATSTSTSPSPSTSTSTSTSPSSFDDKPSPSSIQPVDNTTATDLTADANAAIGAAVTSAVTAAVTAAVTSTVTVVGNNDNAAVVADRSREMRGSDGTDEDVVQALMEGRFLVDDVINVDTIRPTVNVSHGDNCDDGGEDNCDDGGEDIATRTHTAALPTAAASVSTATAAVDTTARGDVRSVAWEEEDEKKEEEEEEEGLMARLKRRAADTAEKQANESNKDASASTTSSTSADETPSSALTLISTSAISSALSPSVAGAAEATAVANEPFPDTAAAAAAAAAATTATTAATAGVDETLTPPPPPPTTSRHIDEVD